MGPDNPPWNARAVHLFLLNRGVLITPYHNMMLVSPATSDTDLASPMTALDAFLNALEEANAQPPP